MSPATSNGADRSVNSREHTSSSTRTTDSSGTASVTGKNPNRSQIPDVVAGKSSKMVGRVRVLAQPGAKPLFKLRHQQT